MSALNGIIIEGFKSISFIEQTLRPINVLIGANGSGKSNFIDAISLLRSISKGQLQRYTNQAGGADRMLHFGSKVTRRMVIQFLFDYEESFYVLELRPDNADGLYLSDASYHPDDPHYSESEQSSYTSRNVDLSLPEHVRKHIQGWLPYHFHDTSSTSPMKKTGEVNDNRRLRPDGSNLAAFLYYLNKKHILSYNLIRRTVQSAAPFFDDFELEPLALNEDNIRFEWRHHGSDAYFDASSLSDGTLRFVALATLLLQPASLRPSLILLDEPELGLHPYAISLLASLLKKASVETQIVLATQSPILLDHFEPEDVLVADRVRGATELRSLDEASLKVWLEEYSLGQLWEKNEFGGRPIREGIDRDGESAR